jgi:predicted nucleotidyltransferase
VKLKKEILAEIKRRVKASEPDAKIILYGSYARGDANDESDIDLLILVDKTKMDYDEKMKIESPLYRLGFETGLIISPLVKTKHNWEENFFFTPLYYNIKEEGIEI